jgi:hypothetical protein
LRLVGTNDPSSQAYGQLYGLMAVVGVIIIKPFGPIDAAVVLKPLGGAEVPTSNRQPGGW